MRPIIKGHNIIPKKGMMAAALSPDDGQACQIPTSINPINPNQMILLKEDDGLLISDLSEL